MANGAILVFIWMTCDPACRTVMARARFLPRQIRSFVARMISSGLFSIFVTSQIASSGRMGRKTRLKLPCHSSECYFCIRKIKSFCIKGKKVVRSWPRCSVIAYEQVFRTRRCRMIEGEDPPLDERTRAPAPTNAERIAPQIRAF